MHVSFALFADAANLSQEGKLNILGVFDAVQVATLPTVHRRATLIVHLKGDRRDVGSHRLTLRWLSPSGHELWASHGEVQVQGAPESEMMDLPVIAAVDLPLDHPGTYAMNVTVDDGPVAAVPLHVRLPLPPVAPGMLLS
ncbi:MAG TPA: hypothetical protein VGE02_10900 [Gemmatimonadales bacterium]